MMSYCILRFFIYSLAVPLLFTIWLCQTTLGQQQITSDTDTRWGVRKTTIKTGAGTLTVNMPDDASLGDTISGTVVAEPGGETVEERQANMDTLEGYVVDTEDVPAKVVEVEPEDTATNKPEGKKVVTLEIPSAITGEIIDLILKDPKGDQAINIEVPVSPPSTYTPPSVPDGSDFNLPDIGQAGRPIEMTGPFDGEIVNTDVKIGGKNAKVLAQSPRKTAVESPNDVVGPTDIELTQGDVNVTQEYRSLAFKLSADRLTLKKGEQTTLNAEVLGLEGIQESVPVNIVNKTPGVVTMEGGNAQTVTVNPEDVGSGNSFTISRTLTGIKPGAFSISARISPEHTTVPGAGDGREPGSGVVAGIPEEGDVVEISDDSCTCENIQVKLEDKIEDESYNEKFEEVLDEHAKVTKTRAMMSVPYKYRTKCKGQQGADCSAKIKVQVEKKNWRGQEPESEEVHNGKAGNERVGYLKSGGGGEIEEKSIACTAICQRGGKWSAWETGTLYYEAVFGQLESNFEEGLAFTLTPEECGSGRKNSKSYKLYGCECNNVTLVLPGAKKEPGGTFFILGDDGTVTDNEPGTNLRIPYEFSIDCRGKSSAMCNAQIEIQAKPVMWTVHWATKDGNTVRTRGQEVNPSSVKISQPKAVKCSGKCGGRGKTTQVQDNKLKFGIEVDGQRSVDRHEGQLELSFKHKYCDDFKIMDKSARGAEVIGKAKIDVDIKSANWKNLVND